MNIFLPRLLLLFFLTCAQQAWADNKPAEMLEAIIKVRSIVPKEARTARSLGTEREGNGVVIDSNGLILTIGYLILEAESIEVVDAEENHIPATFIGYDHHTGFGILRAGRPLEVTPMKLGQSSNLNAGDPVLVVGHNGVNMVQGARVVSRGEFAGYWEYLLDNAIYTSPPHPEYGGAALIGREGRLLGIGSIFTQLMIPEVGLIPCNMFVPIDLLKPILSDLVNAGRVAKPQRPWLGVHLEETHGRVIVVRVSSGGPAEQAGVQPGDILLKVKESAVKGLADCYRKIWSLGKAGVEVPLIILKGTQIREIKIRSSDRYRYFQSQPGKGVKKVSFSYPRFHLFKLDPNASKLYNIIK